MKAIKHIVAALALVGGLSLTAQAQIGSGWTSTTVSFTTQTSSGCTVTSGDSKGAGVFNIDGGSGRAERRFATITSGSRQFQGNFVMNSLGGDKVAVFQTFSEANGPWQMGAVQKSPAQLYEVEGGNTLVSYTVGAQLRINTITTSGGSVTVYTAGTSRESKSGGTNPYNKIGCYATGSGAGPAKVTWSAVNFWSK